MKLTNGVSSGPVVHASVRSADVMNVSILIASHCYNTTILAAYID